MATTAVVSVGLATSIITASAQKLEGAARWADSVQRTMLAARQTGDPAQLASVVALAERALTVHPDDALLLLYRGYALYHGALLRFRPGSTADATVDQLLNSAVDVLERSVAKRQTSEAHAMLSAVFGLQIARDPSLGQSLGARSADEISEAILAGPTNPRAWLQRGISLINTPEEWGGGAAAAETPLKKAVTLFETDRPVPPNPSWGRTEAHVWLGTAYLRTGRKDEARAEFQKAAALEPSNQWVKGLLASVNTTQ